MIFQINCTGLQQRERDGLTECTASRLLLVDIQPDANSVCERLLLAHNPACSESIVTGRTSSRGQHVIDSFDYLNYTADIGKLRWATSFFLVCL